MTAANPVETVIETMNRPMLEGTPSIAYERPFAVPESPGGSPVTVYVTGSVPPVVVAVCWS